MEWISVEDRLPPYDKTVLIYYTESNFRWPDEKCFIYTASLELCCYKNKHEWCIDLQEIEVKGSNQKLITHWMPLPKPPEE